ncbi:MAG: peptidylprolyl isomerase [Pseudomonadota bacterium]
MLGKAAAIWAALALPAAATGIEIVVQGEANGVVKIDLLEELAPLHAERIATLAAEGFYDGVAFHRVIPGFMAQTGDGVNAKIDAYNGRMAGTGGSSYPDLPAEFSDVTFDRGVVGMARSTDPNSANSQFFIMFQPGAFLDGQYTVVGRVSEGMEVVDAIKSGTRANNGAITGRPDVMQTVTVTE